MKAFVVFSFFLLAVIQSFCQTNLLDSISIAVQNGTYSNVDAVIISQNGKTVYEKYFHDFTRDSLHDTRSSFKSITALLVGIGIEKGFIKSVHDKIYPFFPEYKKIENPDKRKNDITIENLLEMKSGFDCEEFYDTKFREGAMTDTDDWIKYSLDLPLAHNPGEVWAYCSSNPMILSGVITNASGMTIQTFSDKYFFSPLGIKNYQWSSDLKGHGMTAGSFYILPTDMLKIGQMVLNKGVWQGKRIVSAAWIKEMTQPITKIDSFSFVKLSRTKLATPQQTYYGYFWYTEKIKTGKIEESIHFASGNGGQYIMIIDRLNIVVVFTGSSYDSWKSKLPFEILIKYILPYFDAERHS